MRHKLRTTGVALGLYAALASCASERPLSPASAMARTLSPATNGPSAAATLPAVRISEIHYDNTGTDADERIEISGPAGTDLTGWSVVLYNGSNGAAYNTRTLSETIPATCDPRGVVVLAYPVNGIQNGAPDGIALVDPGNTVVEFLSYEGTFAAADGPAAGMLSTDIVASQSGGEPLGSSLQRDGADVWSASLGTNTFGGCNDNTVPPPPPPPPALPDVRIVELHYDNTGTDVGEAVEVEGPAGTDLTGWKIVLYNGSGGAAYDTDALSGTIPATCGARGVVVLNYSSNGIQNGAPDGLALVDASNNVVEFLSYEGTFAATNGPAAGMTSVSIGVSEAGNEPLGMSLWRDASGEWHGPTANTFGACNEGPTPPPPPTPTTIVINELMAAPHHAQGGASWGEWFEVYNYGAAPVDLQGWTIASSGQPSHTITSSLVVPAGGFAVLGRGADPSLNGGVSIDYNYFTGGSTIFLDNTDVLELRVGGTLVDRVQWTTASTMVRGVTRALRDHTVDNTNAGGPNWGYSTVTFGDGDFGTPGAANGALSDTPPAVPNTIFFSGRTSNDPPLPLGFQDQIFGTLTNANGDAVPTTFTWTPENGNASVDEDGVMTALAPGVAVLRATAADGTTRTYALPTRVAVASPTAQYVGNTEFGVPADADASDDFIVQRSQYTASYNRNRGIPNWVSFNLEESHFGPEDRCDCFTFDPLLPSGFARYTTADYTGAGAAAGYGIDRGHLARSFDRTSGSLDNATTFYFTNIIPQAADNNQGPWSAMEIAVGDLARFQNKELYVIAGASGSKGTVKDEGLITIPSHVWKVVVIMPRDQGIADVRSYADVEVIAAVIPNDPGIRNVNWETYRTTVNAVEALSGYDVLALLEDRIENLVESGMQDEMVLVDQLLADGKLSPGNANSLAAKLHAAAASLDRGNTTAAVNQLRAFLNEVDSLERSRRLGAEDAELLRAAIGSLLASVQG